MYGVLYLENISIYMHHGIETILIIIEAKLKLLLHQLCRVSSLHLDHFIIASPIVERVASLREVVQDSVLIERRDSTTIEPRQR